MAGVRLGESFLRLNAIAEQPAQWTVTPEDLVLLFGQLAEMREELRNLPGPQVNVAPPDLGAIVTAVNGLHPGASAEEIALELAKVLQPNEPVVFDTTVLADLAATLKKLEFRLNAPGPGMSGPYSVTVPGVATDNSIKDIKRGLTDYESRLDYDVRTDTQPVYIGRAENGTATAGLWTIEKITYDTNRPTRKQVLTGSWDNRASLPW